MIGASPDFLGAAASNLAHEAAVIEECRLLLTRQSNSNHYPQPLLGGDIEQPARRTGVGSNGVDPSSGHRDEVADARSGELHGVQQLEISLSHTRGLALAQALALRAQD